MNKRRTDRLTDALAALENAVNGLQMLALEDLAYQAAFEDAAELLAYLEALQTDQREVAKKILQ